MSTISTRKRKLEEDDDSTLSLTSEKKSKSVSLIDSKRRDFIIKKAKLVLYEDDDDEHKIKTIITPSEEQIAILSDFYGQSDDDDSDKDEDVKSIDRDGESKVETKEEKSAVASKSKSLRGCNIKLASVAGSGKSTILLMCAKLRPDKKFLIITYNKSLQMDVEQKIKDFDLEENVTILTYHAAAARAFECKVSDDVEFLNALKSFYKSKSRELPGLDGDKLRSDVLGIDEAQDSIIPYYLLIEKIVEAQPKLQTIVVGDVRQSINQFKGARVEFLTQADQLPGFSSKCQRRWVTHYLTTSYRLTPPMADFINHHILGTFAKSLQSKQKAPEKETETKQALLTTTTTTSTTSSLSETSSSSSSLSTGVDGGLSPVYVGIIGSAGRRDDKDKMSIGVWNAMLNITPKIIQHILDSLNENSSTLPLTSTKTYTKNDIVLVSGGAAWADHVAVYTFLQSNAPELLSNKEALVRTSVFGLKEDEKKNLSQTSTSSFRGLTLYLPAPFQHTNVDNKIVARASLDCGYLEDKSGGDWKGGAGGIANYYHREFAKKLGHYSKEEQLLTLRHISAASALEGVVLDSSNSYTSSSSEETFKARNTSIAKRVQYLIAFTWGSNMSTAPKHSGTCDTWNKCSEEVVKIHVPLARLINKTYELPLLRRSSGITSQSVTSSSGRTSSLSETSSTSTSSISNLEKKINSDNQDSFDDTFSKVSSSKSVGFDDTFSKVQVVGGNTRGKWSRLKVQYVAMTYFQMARSIGEIVKRVTREYGAENVAIITPSTKSIKSPGSKNPLAIAIREYFTGIPLYIPRDDEQLSKSLVKGKLVICSWNSMKGTERDCIIITPFDESYFQYYCKDWPHADRLPEIVYVAATRASKELILIADPDKTLRTINFSRLKQDCTIIDESRRRIKEPLLQKVLQNTSKTTKAKPDEKKDQRTVTATDLLKHLDSATMFSLMNMLKVSTSSLPEEEDEVPEGNEDDDYYQYLAMEREEEKLKVLSPEKLKFLKDGVSFKDKDKTKYTESVTFLYDMVLPAIVEVKMYGSTNFASRACVPKIVESMKEIESSSGSNGLYCITRDAYESFPKGFWDSVKQAYATPAKDRTNVDWFKLAIAENVFRQNGHHFARQVNTYEWINDEFIDFMTNRMLTNLSYSHTKDRIIFNRQIFKTLGDFIITSTCNTFTPLPKVVVSDNKQNSIDSKDDTSSTTTSSRHLPSFITSSSTSTSEIDSCSDGGSRGFIPVLEFRCVEEAKNNHILHLACIMALSGAKKGKLYLLLSNKIVNVEFKSSAGEGGEVNGIESEEFLKLALTKFSKKSISKDNSNLLQDIEDFKKKYLTSSSSSSSSEEESSSSSSSSEEDDDKEEKGKDSKSSTSNKFLSILKKSSAVAAAMTTTTSMTSSSKIPTLTAPSKETNKFLSILKKSKV